MKTKKLLLGLSVAFATVLAACGGTNNSTNKPSSTSSPSASTPIQSVSSTVSNSTDKNTTSTSSSTTPIISGTSSSSTTPSVSTSTGTNTSTSTSTTTPDLLVLEKITVKGSYKVSYNVGEALDLTGMELKLSFSDGSSETIPVTADMIGEVDMSTAGIKTITVTYQSVTTTFNIEVIATAVEKVDPEVTFSIESGATIKVGEAAPTVTVTEGLNYVVYYEQDEVRIGDTMPTTPGRYAIVVEVTGNDQYNDAREYRWFDLVENKLDAEVTISIESGTTLTIGVDSAPTATVTEGLDYITYYEQDGEKVSDTMPTTPGTYSFIVEVTGNEEYNGTRVWRWFYLVEDKLNPTVTFSIESGATLTIGVDAAPTVTIEGDLEYTVHYEKSEAFYSDDFPTEAGTYAMVVTATGNDTYNGTTKWVVFTLVEPSVVEKVDPEVTFSIESGATLTIGVDAAPTVTVTEGLEYVVYYEQDEVKVSDTLPTTPGRYVIVVEVTGNDQYNATRQYRWFDLVENKLNPTVTFSVETGTELVLGYDSAPTVTVEGDLAYTVHYEKNEAFYSNDFPTETGTYAMVVTVTGNDIYNGTSKWIVFNLVEPASNTYGLYVNGTVKGAMNVDASDTNADRVQYVITLDLTAGDRVTIKDASGNAVTTWWENTSSNSSEYVATATGSYTFYFKDYTISGGGTSVWVSIPAAPVDPSLEPLTVYYTNPNGWSNVNAYVWDANNIQHFGNWPGTAMNYDSTTGYYYIENVTPGHNIIFNDGTSQTVDLQVPTDGNYVYDGTSWTTLATLSVNA